MKYETTTKHSPFLLKIVKSAFFFLLFLPFVPQQAKAQMFSVGEDDAQTIIPPLELYLAYEPMNVTYQGNNLDFEIPPGLPIDIFAFSGPVVRLGYNSPTINLSLASGGEITGLDNVSYFDFGGNINVNLNLYRTPTLSIQLPVQFSSRYTNITNSVRFNLMNVNLSNRFRFSNLNIGAGLKLFARPLTNLRFETGIIPSYGFAFASGGVFGGSLATVSAGARLFIDRIFGEVGLSLGYQYNLRNYNVDEALYDYRMNAHSIQLGITF